MNSSSLAEEEDTIVLCLICHKATCGKYKYYGSKCCHGCRNFFRRIVQSNSYQKLECSLPDSSKNDSKGCRHCRFQQCLKAGLQVCMIE